MTTNFRRTAAWLAACGKEPSEPNLSVQIGCHIEEFVELLRCLRVPNDGYALLLERTATDLEWFAGKLKSRQQFAYIPTHLREPALDALCDGEVTGNGVAYLAQMNKDQADQAVLAANDAKLVDGKPVFVDGPGSKIAKPPGWKAPDLTPFV